MTGGQGDVIPGIFRLRDIERLGLTRGRLRDMLARGDAEKMGRGVYCLPSQVTELHSVATVCARVSGAIVCLLTALAVHRIGTQLPRDVWIAIDRKARKPRVGDLCVGVRTVRFSGAMLRYGIEERSVQGVAMRITSPARTVVDCFRYRNKIGRDVALEALRDAIDDQRVAADEIVRAAEVCRIYSVLRPYLQAVLA